MDIRQVLSAHDAQIRRTAAVPPGFTVHATDRWLLVEAPEGSDSSYVEWSGLSEDTADEAIAAVLARLGSRPFEWKTYARDTPADLTDRLTAAGFTGDDPEAFVVGELADVLAATEGHDEVDGIEIRALRRDDLDAMVALSGAVWGEVRPGMFSELFAERDHDPSQLQLFGAFDGGTLVSYGWVRLPLGVQFASLWGGSTLAGFRGRGIYRALVRRRALLARESGHRWLQVDCSPDSRPILERLGMATIDTTTPYRWTP
jgi:ribosomal protein S18 acetylase RimI-like enzyme